MLGTVAAVVVGGATATLVWLIAAGQPQARIDVLNNLGRGIERTTSGRVAASESRTWVRRAVARATPAGSVTRIDRLLTLAGRPVRWPLARVVVAKWMATVSAVGVGALYVSQSVSTSRIAGTALVCGIVHYIPELLLFSRGQERQKMIERQLADTLDQMIISVEAGLGFDAAMSRAATAGHGPLAEELMRTLQEVQVGVPRRVAFRNLGERTRVADLQRFVGALLQADIYGIPLAHILRTQAVEVRRKRRYRAEQRAMQIPVKVVFPLVFFILPTLFIVLLGPAVVDIVRAFR